MKIRGAVFDADGTLLDSMYIWETIASDYLRSRGIEPEEGLDKKFASMSVEQAAAYYMDHYGIGGSVPGIVAEINRMVEEEYFYRVAAKSGVRMCLEKMKRMGIRMCVATATDRRPIERALERNGLLEYFEEILTCTEVGAGKESPLIFEKAIEKIGVKKEETVVLEDALHAVKTAKEAGFLVVCVYDASSAAQWREITALGDYAIRSFEGEMDGLRDFLLGKGGKSI
ncbi:MAG: HAD family phosphatase [Eubacteriales bacterium]|nr:HAD family phosphatase [Eubacteriales bacterium]